MGGDYGRRVELYEALGLTASEAEEIRGRLGREPNDLELAMFAVMWSEHCSYKSSRLHLRRLPTEAPWVLVGPGENAGVVDVGGGLALAIRIESHNHPSAIEPVQGAATGVGGIIRDIFTMGARPIALMDALAVGPLSEPGSRHLLAGIVQGISSYGNSVGVPTVGGALSVDPSYRTNPLVNVLCVGLLPTERLVLARAGADGSLVVLLGAPTGRDGIGGVSVLASAELAEAGSDHAEAKRPSVQVGDPYEEKRLIEACLDLLDAGLIQGIQDLGGAGLTCAASEMAARSRVGIDLDLSAVVRREPGMTPAEVMTSESQERMLAAITPADLPRLQEICARHEVEAHVVGQVRTTTGGRLRIFGSLGGPLLAEVPAAALADEAPLYDRPRRPPEGIAEARREPVAPADDRRLADDLCALLTSSRWIYEQYDHQLFLNTVLGPGRADATVLRLQAPGVAVGGTGAMALTTDGVGRWAAADPRRGARLVVAEAVANLACVGAVPRALVNCLNLGNPEHPEVVWQLSEIVDGLAEAADGFGLPIVGGNVSLYNTSDGEDILPTPVVGLVGLLPELSAPMPGLAPADGHELVLVGPEDDHLGGTRFAFERLGERCGVPNEVDLGLHRRLGEFVQSQVAAEIARRRTGAGPVALSAAHDVSEGGLAVALAEMAVASGRGLEVTLTEATPGVLFSEAPSRILLAVAAAEPVVAAARAAGLPARACGHVGGSRFRIGDARRSVVDLAVRDLAVAAESLGVVMAGRGDAVGDAVDDVVGDAASGTVGPPTAPTG